MRITTVILSILVIVLAIATFKFRSDADASYRDFAEAVRVGQELEQLLSWYRVWEEENAHHTWYVWDPESGKCMFCDNPAKIDESSQQKAFCALHSDCLMMDDGTVLATDSKWLWLKWNMKIKAYEVTGCGQPPHGDPRGDFDPMWVDLSIPAPGKL